MKKTIGLTVLTIMSYLGLIGGIVWAIVSFIIYLVKDEPFHWGSLWLTGVSLVAMIFFFIWMSVSQHKYKAKRKSEAPQKAMSKFQQRLAEMEAKRSS